MSVSKITDNAYLRVRQERCEWCRCGNDPEGRYHFVEHEYRTSGDERYILCAAPTEAEYIEELTARVEELEKDKAGLMEIAEYVAGTLPKRAVHADEPSSLPMFQAWVSESMVLHARDVLAATKQTAQGEPK